MSMETVKKRSGRGRILSEDHKEKMAEGRKAASAKRESQARAQQQADHISGEVMTVEAPMPVRSALADVHVPKEVEPKSAPLSPQYLKELESEKIQLEGSLLGESGMKIKNQSDLQGLPAGVFDSAPEFAAKIDGDSARNRIAEIDKIVSDACLTAIPRTGFFCKTTASTTWTGTNTTVQEFRASSICGRPWTRNAIRRTRRIGP